MKKRLTMLLAAGGLVLGASQQAYAIPSPFNSAFKYRDADPIGSVIAPGGFYSSSFNVSVDDGNGPFTVGSPFTASQHLGEEYTSNDGYVPGDAITDGEMNFWFHDSNGDNFNITVGVSTVINNINAGPVVFKSETLNGTIIADLEADGSVSYRVDNLGSSDITFDYAVLGVNVPDGGATALLLGLGFLGLGVITRMR